MLVTHTRTQIQGRMRCRPEANQVCVRAQVVAVAGQRLVVAGCTLLNHPPILRPLLPLSPRSCLQLRQGVEAQQRNPLHAYHSRVRLLNYDCYFFEPITLEELDKVRPGGSVSRAFVRQSRGGVFVED